MITIYKYQIEITDKQKIDMPAGSIVLSVNTQDNTPCIWVMVDTDKPLIPYRFKLFGTGQVFEPWFEGRYIGTFQVLGGHGVFHLFHN